MKLRIVTDTHAGFEVQAKRWWWPFWWQCGKNGLCVNTHPSVECAEEFAIEYRKQCNRKTQVVKEL